MHKVPYAAHKTASSTDSFEEDAKLVKASTALRILWSRWKRVSAIT
jgi:hypothetical protein